jgi:hypothetical protein
MELLGEGTHAPFRLPRRGAWEVMLMAFVVVPALVTVKALVA